MKYDINQLIWTVVLVFSSFPQLVQTSSTNNERGVNLNQENRKMGAHNKAQFEQMLTNFFSELKEREALFMLCRVIVVFK
jgi:hypothetical protein